MIILHALITTPSFTFDLESCNYILSVYFYYRYDTFEMLRENLDVVLKDLLEFKSTDYVASSYPGPRLDLDDSFLNILRPSTCPNHVHKMHIDIVLKSSEVDGDELPPYNIHEHDKSKIINRIRRYLDKVTYKNKSRTKYKIHEYIFKEPKRYKRSMKQQSKSKLLQPINKTKMRYRRQLLTKKRVKRRQKSIEEIISHFRRLKKTTDSAAEDGTLKARYLFKSCMNHAILQKRAQQPLLDLLDLFGGWPILNPEWSSLNFDWLELMAKLRLFNNDILISEWVGPDIKNSDEYVIQFDQTSLGILIVLLRAKMLFICKQKYLSIMNKKIYLYCPISIFDNQTTPGFYERPLWPDIWYLLRVAPKLGSNSNRNVSDKTIMFRFGRHRRPDLRQDLRNRYRNVSTP